MPSKSAKQARLMRIAANNKEFADKVGIDQKIAREWYEEDKKLNAKKGIHKVSKEEEDAQILQEDMDKLTDELMTFSKSVESMIISGTAQLIAGGVTDEQVAAFKDMGDEILADSGQTLTGPETMSAVDAATDLELSLEHLRGLHQSAVRALYNAVFKAPSMESYGDEEMSLETFQQLFHMPAPEKPEIDGPVTQVAIRPQAIYDGMSADSNAVRWIEARKNLDSLRVFIRLIRSTGSLEGDEFAAAKRLLKQIMTTSNFYVDQLDYANTLDQLEVVMNTATAQVDTRIQMSWKPGMPGYGLEAIGDNGHVVTKNGSE